MSMENRLRAVDDLLDTACVSLTHFTTPDLKLAKDICEIFGIPFGTLIRRAEAIRLLGENVFNADLLKEAARQIIAGDG